MESLFFYLCNLRASASVSLLFFYNYMTIKASTTDVHWKITLEENAIAALSGLDVPFSNICGLINHSPSKNYIDK